MGIFDQGGSVQESLQNPDKYLGYVILDEVSKLSDEQIDEFCNSPEAEAFVEAGIIGRKTLVRLSKNHDLVRREKMACFELAKEHNDQLWKKLVENRRKERALIAAIVKKYSSKAERVAKVAQKNYLSQKLPFKFMRPGSNGNNR